MKGQARRGLAIVQAIDSAHEHHAMTLTPDHEHIALPRHRGDAVSVLRKLGVARGECKRDVRHRLDSLGSCGRGHSHQQEGSGHDQSSNRDAAVVVTPRTRCDASIRRQTLAPPEVAVAAPVHM